jgi:outer membrane protein
MSGYRPVITGNADITHQHTYTRPATASNGSTTSKTYGVNLTQNVFTGFQVTNAVREAEAAVRAGRETLRDIERIVLLEAVTAYMDVVRDQAIVRLQENNVSVLSRELKATQDRFAVGEVTRTDVAQAQARRAGAVSQLDLARANLKTSRGAYERTVGSPPNNLAEPSVPEKMLPKTLEEAIAISARENALVVAALYREQGSRHTVDRIRGELLPQVTVQASFQNTDDPSRTLEETESAEVSGRVVVPFYEGGEVRARVRQAKHTHVSRLQEIEQVRTEVQQFVVAAWSQLQAARGQLESDQVQVQSNRIALAGVREEEKVGQRTLLDVLNAEQELVNSEVQLVTTRRNLVVAAYAVLGAIGRLEVVNLGVASQVYDPEEHYFEVRRKWFGISITHGDGRREMFDFWDTHGKNLPMK